MMSIQTKLTVGSLAVLAVIIGAARFGMREPTPPSAESIVSDHPVEIKVGRWYRWQITELVMDERGRHYPQPDPTYVDFLDSQRKGFRRKFGSAARLGFHEGQVPPSDEFCGAPYPLAKILWASPRSNLDFTLMIHDVAVTATIDEVIPGFWGRTDSAGVAGPSRTTAHPLAGAQIRARAPRPNGRKRCRVLLPGNREARIQRETWPEDRPHWSLRRRRRRALGLVPGPRSSGVR